MPVSRSILAKTDRDDEKMSKKRNVPRILHIIPITFIQKLIDPI
jgi:hypothetical protein